MKQLRNISTWLISFVLAYFINAEAIVHPADFSELFAQSASAKRKFKHSKKKFKGKVNINKAGVNKLTSIPGVSKKIAKRIVKKRKKRKFKSIKKVKRIKGVSKRRYAKMKRYIKTKGKTNFSKKSRSQPKEAASTDSMEFSEVAVQTKTVKTKRNHRSSKWEARKTMASAAPIEQFVDNESTHILRNEFSR